jgi:CRISPR-associated endonuclease/helicase Cas3
MMVLFVSQCEKHALQRTRRVLDSFANRIGDSTWQTVITQEGLDAVKKLLRKTATKNTAVSCHWIRGRSRTQLNWIVGSSAKFNTHGLVPVNYTHKDILVKYNENRQIVFANTNEQPLDQHLFAVGFLAREIVSTLYPNDSKLALAAYISGVWHDIGKLDPQFQKWLISTIKKSKVTLDVPEDGLHIDSPKFSFDKYPRHNEISLMLFNLLFDKISNTLNRSLVAYSEHAILWHHAKPIRKSEYKNQSEIYSQFVSKFENADMAYICQQVQSMIKDVNQLADSYGVENNIQLTPLDMDDIDLQLNVPLPDYKSYSNRHQELADYKKDVTNNSKKNILRTAVISADRLVSNLEADILENHIQNQTLNELVSSVFDQSGSSLMGNIEACLDRFNKPENEARNIQQTTAADKLVDAPDVAVLKGPAGCGKTKIALEWALKTGAQKILWICPRVQVCLGLYEELSSDEYLPESSIELLTGEFQKIKRNGLENISEEHEQFSGDIVLTTIDQVINAITTHRQITALIEYLNSHIVFDEFHELIKIHALNLLFAELVDAKKMRGKSAHTLLVSATPNPYFVTEFLGIHKDDIIGVSTFNQSPYQINLTPYDENSENSPLVTSTYPKNTFVISNTAKDAQMGFIQHQATENAILIHGRFKKQDKLKVFDEVYRSFKRGGCREFDVLRAGPIVQASLNISCDAMVTELTSPENWLQRLGRLDRFGQNSEINIYTTFIPKSVYDMGKQSSASAKFLNSGHDFLSAYAWLEFLKINISDSGRVTLNELYQLYSQFYLDELSIPKIKEDLLKNLEKSAGQLINKLHDTISFPPKKNIKGVVKKIKASSLRGDSRFVQMAVIQYDELGRFKILDEYVCDAETPDNQFTMSVDEIQGYDEAGDSNLVSYMYQKHPKIMKAKGIKYAKRHKSFLIKNEAVDAQLPIYLSYTEADLALCNDQPHPDAIYYALGTKQPIGAISIKKINSVGE